MQTNPYEPPTADVPAPERKKALVLAGIGAWLASAYWAAITLLLMLSVAARPAGGAQLLMPVFLVGIYAVRGYQMFMGDVSAARRILWIHGVGGVLAAVQVAEGAGMVMVLHAVKVLIHVFGGAAAWRAQKDA
jgi:hypothetical protein